MAASVNGGGVVSAVGRDGWTMFLRGPLVEHAPAGGYGVSMLGAFGGGDLTIFDWELFPVQGAAERVRK